MTTRHARAARGAAAAWVATIVAATAHTLSGGGAPPPALVGVIGILASPLAVLLVGRRLSAWRIGAAVVAGQALFHVAFAATAGADAGAATAVHAHAAELSGSAAASGLLPDGPMLLGHLLAAAATMLALYGGERMLRALGRGIHSVLRRTQEPVTATVAVPRVAWTAPLVHAPGLVLSDLSRRGPPSLVIAVS